MKIYIRFNLFILFFLSSAYQLEAQDLNFSIQYPLEIDFSASGVEKDQLIELENGNLVFFRFTLDSATLNHKVHLWSSTPESLVIWSKEFSLGIGDSVRITGSLCANENKFVLAYPTVLGNGNTIATVTQFDSNGNLLETARVSIFGSVLAENLCVLFANGEYYLGGTAIDQSNTRRVFVTRSENESFALAETQVSDELKALSTLYMGNDQRPHIVARKETQHTDLVWDNQLLLTGIAFPDSIRIIEAISDSIHGTFYSGSVGNITIGAHDAILMRRDIQNNFYCKSLYTTGAMFHGSYSTDLAFIGNGVAMIGYGSVPHPITFFSKFDYNCNPELSREFGNYQPFNYNRTNLLAHSSGKTYYTVLGGVFTNGVSAFSTIFNCLNTNFQTLCDGDIISSIYNDMPVSLMPDTVSFTQSTNITIEGLDIQPNQFTDSIPCASNLNTTELNLNQIELVPNPFSEKTTLQLPEGFSAQNTEIICTDALGRILLFNSINNVNEIQIQFKESVKGVVIFHLKNGKNEGIVRGILE